MARSQKAQKDDHQPFIAESITIKSVSDLFPYVNNARTHSEDQIAQICASINEFGFTNPILIEPSGQIIAGHGRLMAAKKLGFDRVPCIVADGWSKAQIKAYVLADNKLALNAGWDNELLAVEFAELQDMEFDLDLTGFSDFEIDEILNEATPHPTIDESKEDDVPEAPVHPVSREGDIWLLGDHRLMCGDSTSIDAVEKLMGGGHG